MEISGLLNEMGKYCTAEKPAVIYFYHDRLLLLLIVDSSLVMYR